MAPPLAGQRSEPKIRPRSPSLRRDCLCSHQRAAKLQQLSSRFLTRPADRSAGLWPGGGGGGGQQTITPAWYLCPEEALRNPTLLLREEADIWFEDSSNYAGLSFNDRSGSVTADVLHRLAFQKQAPAGAVDALRAKAVGGCGFILLQAGQVEKQHLDSGEQLRSVTLTRLCDQGPIFL